MDPLSEKKKLLSPLHMHAENFFAEGHSIRNSTVTEGRDLIQDETEASRKQSHDERGSIQNLPITISSIKID
jgi:hypothetical protein